MPANVFMPKENYEKSNEELIRFAEFFYNQISIELFDEYGDAELTEEMVDRFVESIVISSFMADGDFSKDEYELFSVLLSKYNFSYDEAEYFCKEVTDTMWEMCEEIYVTLIEEGERDLAIMITKLAICCIIIDGYENYSEHKFFQFLAAGIKSLICL